MVERPYEKPSYELWPQLKLLFESFGQRRFQPVTPRLMGRFIYFQRQNNPNSWENDDPIRNEVSRCYNIKIMYNIFFKIYIK